MENYHRQICHNKKPNVLFIMVDELRHPVIYESDELKKYSENYIWNFLKKEGMYFDNHYCAATACVPSRTVLYTGQMGILSAPINTDGGGKTAHSPDMYWLDPQNIPTMGHYFRQGGYETHWIGKWHVSDPDLYVPGTDIIITSYNNIGVDDDSKIELYKKTNRLKQYGFDSWIGPTPHGPSPLTTGASAKDAFGRDQSYTKQATNLLDKLTQQSCPWLLVLSYVNPHDIAMYGLETNNPATGFDFSVSENVPKIIFNPLIFNKSHDEDLSTKPSAQLSYQEAYKNWFPAPSNQLEYQRVYYNLQKKVSDEITVILDKLKSLGILDTTLIIFTSDHGDLLGSHGNMHQKWYNMYEETTHVPFIIRYPGFISENSHFTPLTSHLDFIPTILGLCNIPNVLTFPWNDHFINYQPLPGRDLSSIILQNTCDIKYIIDNPIFFMTDDDIVRGVADGAQGSNFLGLPPKQITQPTHIMAIFVNLSRERLLALGINVKQDYCTLKYAIYYDYEQAWTNPEGVGVSVGIPNNIEPTQPVDDLTIIYRYVNIDNQAKATCQRLFKSQPINYQVESYNLTLDPLELNNLSNHNNYHMLNNYLNLLLNKECKKKRLLPLYAPNTMKVC